MSWSVLAEQRNILSGYLKLKQINSRLVKFFSSVTTHIDHLTFFSLGEEEVSWYPARRYSCGAELRNQSCRRFGSLPILLRRPTVEQVTLFGLHVNIYDL
jgi:hypothetical protein